MDPGSQDRQIRVNTISPVRPARPACSILPVTMLPSAGLADYLAAQIPMGASAIPARSQARRCSASDDASFVNGIELFVDGGQQQI